MPLQPVERVARGMPLRDDAAGQALAGAGVVALGAGQVDLAYALAPQRFAAFARCGQARVGGWGDGHAA